MASLVQEWGFEVLKGLGKLFLNPVFYYLFFLAAILGVSRVKRERKNFHVRAENAYFELRQLLPLGILIGFLLSIVMIGVGVVIPIETILFVAIFTFLWSFTTNIRMLSPIYTVGFAFFATIFFLRQEWSFPLIQSHTPDWNVNFLSSIAVLLCMLVVAEGLLIFFNGRKGTSPKVIMSRRGLKVGAHEVKRLWMLPLFLVIPGEAISAPFDWWPVFTIAGQSYSILLVPFAIGFSQQIQGMQPAFALKQFGKRVILFGILLTCLSAVGYWYPLASILVVALAIIGRELLTLRQRITDDNSPFYFSKRNHGVMILGILPESPAAKMGLGVGELITKVNGVKVHNEESFYNALQKNRAHCKLEVLDINDQIRLVQRALYEGENYKLGILFVLDEHKVVESFSG